MVVRPASPRTASAERADLVFHALADATRRDIVRLVMEREHSVSDLARHYPMSFAAVQKHVAVLERADLVTKHRRGRERMVQGRIEAVRDATSLLDGLERTWRDRLQRFGDVLVADGRDHSNRPAPLHTASPRDPSPRDQGDKPCQ
jgi:DNA-binding transcriptional ArsR family regulator